VLVGVEHVEKTGCGGNEPHTGHVAVATYHVTRHNMPVHNIISTAPQLSISQKAIGTLPEDGNVMPKHVGDTIRN
jgi:hypothetical protein